MSYWQMNALQEVMATIFIGMGLVAVVITALLVKARERRRVQEALVKALESGVAPPPEVLKALSETIRPATPPRPQPERDLRNGVIWISAAIGLVAAALGFLYGHDPRYLYLPFKEPIAVLGIAAFPCALGIGYVILWLTGKDKAP